MDFFTPSNVPYAVLKNILILFKKLKEHTEVKTMQQVTENIASDAVRDRRPAHGAYFVEWTIEHSPNTAHPS